MHQSKQLLFAIIEQTKAFSSISYQAIQWQISFVGHWRRIKRRVFFQQSLNNKHTLLCTEAFQGKQLPHSAVKGQSKALHSYRVKQAYAVIYDGELHLQAKDKPIDGICLFVNVVP